MRKSLNLKIGPTALSAALGLSLLTPLALTQISCSTPAKDKTSNQVPQISGLLFADLATPTSAWPAVPSARTANTWTITNGSTTYLRASYGSTGGTAVLSPGNLPVVSNVPIALSPTATTTYTVTVIDAAGHQTSMTGLLNVIAAPQNTITAPLAVTANATGLTAQVQDVPPNPPGTTYAWSATNAAITSPTNGPTITFTAGSANPDGTFQNMTLTCKVTAPSSTPVTLTQVATIPVNAVAPANLVYPIPSAIYYLNLPIQDDVPSVQGTITSYTIDQPLPAGLTLNPATGTITGTPTAAAPVGTYVVTATNSGGSTTATLHIEVQSQPAVVFNAPSRPTIGPGGSSTLSWATDNTVESLVITSVPPDPTLPSTFLLNGTANVSPAQTTVYSLAAVAKDSSLEPVLTQTITVDPTALAFTTDLSLTPSGLVPFGAGTTLNWGLAGTPNQVSLASPTLAGTIDLDPTATSYLVQPVSRRQTFQLTASNGSDSVKSKQVSVYAQGLDRLAGFIIQGAGSHDGRGTAAQFNFPCNIAMDPAGNIYVPDSSNHTIRVVTPDGTTSTLAGMSGVSGTKDGVPGLQAQFYAPRGVAYWVDPATSKPYLFVVEYSNQCVRKISLDTTTTPPTATNVALFAGVMGSYTPLDLSHFDNPSGIVIDNQNNMYVTEQYDGDVLKITGLSGTTGTMAVYAGNHGNDGYVDGPNAGAYFYGISGITIDPAGNLYVTEATANRIRKITSTTTSTLAGDMAQLGTIYNSTTKPVVQGASGFVDGVAGTSRLAAPGSLAYLNGILYVADTKNNAIRALDLSTGILTTVAGTPTTGSATPGTAGSLNAQGTSATFFNPQGIIADPGGNLYIAESGNNDIRKADTSLNITTFAGSAPVVGNADGDPGTGTMAIHPALSTNKTMSSMVQDASGNLYVSDVYNNAIRMITPAGVLSTVAGTAGLTKAGKADGAGPAASFNQPNGMAMDGSGNIYVVDSQNSTIRMMAWDTTNKVWNVSTIAGIAGTTGAADGGLGTSTFKYPYGITFNAKDGCLYVTDSGNTKIRKLTNNGGAWTVASLTVTGPVLSVPMGIGADAAGNLYVADRTKDIVVLLTVPPSGNSWAGTTIGGVTALYGFEDGVVGTARGASSLFNYPEGLTVDATGAVWVADSGNNTIRKIVNGTGGWTTSTPLGQALPYGTVASSGIPMGTSTGAFPATVLTPQSVLVAPGGHDFFVTTNDGVAQATSIDGQ